MSTHTVATRTQGSCLCPEVRGLQRFPPGFFEYDLSWPLRKLKEIEPKESSSQLFNFLPTNITYYTYQLEVLQSPVKEFLQFVVVKYQTISVLKYLSLLI